MKKIIKAGFSLIAGLCLIIAFMVLGTGHSLGNLRTVGQASAEEESEVYGIFLDYNDTVFIVDRLDYYIDGIKVSYYAKGFSTDDGIMYYSVEFSGTSGPLGLMEGEARTEHYLSDPFASQFPGFGIEQKRIAVDGGSEFYCRLSPKSAGIEKNYYMSSFSYRVGATGSYYEIDRATINPYGGYDFTGAYNEGKGCYTQTINTNYTFDYWYAGDDFWFKILDVKADMTIKLATSQRVVGITINGDGKDLVTTNQAYFSYSDVAEIIFTPANGKIIKQLDLYFGSTKVITIYGGMQSGGNAIFSDDATHDKTITYGNYILGYESDFSYAEVESAGNFAKLEVVKDAGGVYEDAETFTITLTDTGVVTFNSNKISEWLRLEVSVQKYAQIDLVNVVDSDKQLSSNPYSSVQLGEGEDAVIYTENIPSRIFMLGFEETIYIKVTLADNYNFTEDVDPLYIEGSYFIDERFDGGKLSIYARKENTVTFSIRLYYRGELFSNSDTKIYISTRDITKVEDFQSATELSTTSSAGLATKRGVDRNSHVKIYIVISPYYIMNVEGVAYAKTYTNFEYLVTNNQTLEIVIEEFYMERPVMLEGEKIGDIRIVLDQLSISLDEEGNIVYNATYQARFKNKDAEDFEVITKTNPTIYGYNLVNMFVGETSILTGYLDGTFGISPTDQELHEYLASIVFNTPTNGLAIVAKFTSKLNNFYFTYNGQYYEGKAYFDESDIFLDMEVDVVERGMYFGGIYYYIGEERFELLTIEDFVPEQITEENEFETMYRYALTSPWKLDDPMVEIFPLILYSTFDVEFVFTTSPTENTSIKGEVKYNSQFSVSGLNTESLPEPTYGTGYNLIGWNMVTDTDVFFIIADESEHLYNATITYDWITDVRFVPVFSQGTATVTIYNPDGEYMNSILVRYDQEIEDSLFELLTDESGEYMVCYKFGYTYLGFFDAQEGGNKVISYTPALDPLYTPLCEQNESYFTFKDGGYVWTLLENLNLYARFNAITYDLDLKIVNPTLHGTKAISFTKGIMEVKAQNHYYLHGFDVTDSFILKGLASNYLSYLAKITIGTSIADGDPVMGEASFYATCDRAGVVTGVDVDGRYNMEDKELLITVADFINADTGADNIYIVVEYLPITCIVSFTANIVAPDGSVIVQDKSSTVYYKFSLENAYINRVSNWEECDETGKTTGRSGWWAIYTPASRLAFTRNSLYGISGLTYRTGSGKEYSFKEWFDFNENVAIDPSLRLDKAYDFVSVFSDVYDVTLNYYSYNDTTKKYVLHYSTGHFWAYESGTGEYFIDNAVTANAYEINLISGELYYITGWADQDLDRFTTVDLAVDMIALNYQLELVYNSDAYEINFYAIYEKFDYSLEENVEEYIINVSLPNDPSGNPYSEDDVIWVAIEKNEYDSYDSSDLSLVDKLTHIFSYGEGIDTAIISVGEILNKADLISDDYYVFAVVQRVLVGSSKPVLYMAIQVI